MITFHAHDPWPSDQQDEFLSPLTSIEHGLSYLLQGRFVEGLEALHKASLLLSPAEAPLATVLGALQEATGSLLHAQHRLQEASKHFAEVEQDWQVHIETVNKLLRTIRATPRPVSSSENRLAHQILHLPASPNSTRLPSEASVPGQATAAGASVQPPLSITCFGRFTVRHAHTDGPELELCRNSRGQMVLRYLLTQPEHQATLDMLMAALYPEEDSLIARHKLQVAISALRCSLNRGSPPEPGAGYILYKKRAYQLNPAIAFYTDVAEFYKLYQAGEQERNVLIIADYYKQACKLYTGPFLVEDLYAEWSFLAREETSRMYLTMCEWLANYALTTSDYETALTWTAAILKIDRCHEEAYRLSMQALAALGRRSEAVRRYQQCQRALAEELGVQPMAETQQVLQTIMRGR